MLKVATFFHLLYFVHHHLLAFSSLCITIVLPSRILSRALSLENVIARRCKCSRWNQKCIRIYIEMQHLLQIYPSRKLVVPQLPTRLLIQGWYCLRSYESHQFLDTKTNSGLYTRVSAWYSTQHWYKLQTHFYTIFKICTSSKVEWVGFSLFLSGYVESFLLLGQNCLSLITTLSSITSLDFHHLCFILSDLTCYGVQPQALEIIFEMQMKRSNEKIARRKIVL